MGVQCPFLAYFLVYLCGGSSHLNCVKCHSTQILISLVGIDVERIFMCLLAIYISFSIRCQINDFYPFLNWIFSLFWGFFLLLSSMSSLYILGKYLFSRCVVYKYFLPLGKFVLHPLNKIFQRANVLNFDKVQFINIFFCRLFF